MESTYGGGVEENERVAMTEWKEDNEKGRKYEQSWTKHENEGGSVGLSLCLYQYILVLLVVWGNKNPHLWLK